MAFEDHHPLVGPDVSPIAAGGKSGRDGGSLTGSLVDANMLECAFRRE